MGYIQHNTSHCTFQSQHSGSTEKEDENIDEIVASYGGSRTESLTSKSHDDSGVSQRSTALLSPFSVSSFHLISVAVRLHLFSKLESPITEGVQ